MVQKFSTAGELASPPVALPLGCASVSPAHDNHLLRIILFEHAPKKITSPGRQTNKEQTRNRGPKERAGSAGGSGQGKKPAQAPY